VLAPAARQADGTYQVNIRLQPENLGVVHVQLQLQGGTVNVSLQAEGDATRDTLRQNLDQLRQQLADSGLSTGRFDVSDGTGNGAPGSTWAQDQLAAPVESSGDNGTEAAAVPAQLAAAAISPSPPKTGQLDVRL